MPGAVGACCASAGTARSPNKRVATSAFIPLLKSAADYLLAFPANYPIPAVFENDALVRQLLPNSVSFGKIASLTGNLPGSGERVDLFIAGGLGTCFYANRPKLLVVLILQHRKNRVKRLQQLIYRGYIALAEFTAIHGRVGFPKQIEHRRRRLRGIQIVFEATFKF